MVQALLAGGVGRVEDSRSPGPPAVTSRFTTPGCTTARSLSRSISRMRFMRENRHHDAAQARDGAAAQARARAAPDDGTPYSRAILHDGGHVLGGAREDHQIRPGLVDAAVVFVQEQVFRAVEITARAQQRRDLLLCGRREHVPILQQRADVREHVLVGPVLRADILPHHLAARIDDVSLGVLESAVVGVDVQPSDRARSGRKRRLSTERPR